MIHVIVFVFMHNDWSSHNNHRFNAVESYSVYVSIVLVNWSKMPACKTFLHLCKLSSSMSLTENNLFPMNVNCMRRSMFNQLKYNYL